MNLEKLKEQYNFSPALTTLFDILHENKKLNKITLILRIIQFLFLCMKNISNTNLSDKQKYYLIDLLRKDKIRTLKDDAVFSDKEITFACNSVNTIVKVFCRKHKYI
jgi:hypothetical protein